MNETLAPISQCDVVNKQALTAYRSKVAKWHRWLKADTHHALWKQIYSMLIEDLTFRTLSAAAEADPESALHSPILARGLIAGYAAMQGLAIRRLVDIDSGVISLRRLVMELQNSRAVLTREVYVAGTGLPYGPDEAFQKALASGTIEGFWAPNTGPTAFFPSMQAHAIFDMLAGTQPEARSRDDQIPKALFKRLSKWLSDSEIKSVVDWSNKLVAHAADQERNQRLDFASLRPTMGTVASAQRRLVRTAEVISAYILRGPIHGSLVPVFQYSQFAKLEVAMYDKQAVKIAHRRWGELAKERDQWTSGVLEELTGRPISAP
jgi:hypothetical protein